MVEDIMAVPGGIWKRGQEELGQWTLWQESPKRWKLELDSKAEYNKS